MFANFGDLSASEGNGSFASLARWRQASAPLSAGGDVGGPHLLEGRFEGAGEGFTVHEGGLFHAGAEGGAEGLESGEV